MDFDQISQYILPIVILLFYFLGGAKKKKDPHPSQEKTDKRKSVKDSFALPLPRSSTKSQQRRPSPEREATQSLPPIKRNLSDFESNITFRQIPTDIAQRTIISAISDERAHSLVSTELSERIDLDQAYAIAPRHTVSRGRALLHKVGSLQDVFILQEILKRPDVF